MSGKPPSKAAWRQRTFRQNLRLLLINVYPPFLGAGIRIRRPDPRTFEVTLKLRWWNQNYVGTQFGGALYTMCDPFYMLLLLEDLGRDYIVWDKAAEIRFLRPGRGTVRARFQIPEVRVEEIRAQADAQDKVEPRFTVDVLDEEGKAVARVEKLLYVRKKEMRSPG
jgi:acyl-coenzyme A thioesterase PaaI-like protein